MERWPHQTYAVNRTLELIAQGERAICITGPTGCGKTVICGDLINEYVANRNQGALLYTNRRLMIEQLSRQMNDIGLGHGIRAAGYGTESSYLFQISSMQTEASRVLKRETWDLYNAPLVMIDEAHMQTGQQAAEIRKRHLESGAVVIEVTATPFGLGEYADVLVVAGKPSELRAYTPPCLVPAVHYGPDEPEIPYSAIKRVGDDLTDKANAKIMMRKGLVGRVLSWFVKLNPEMKPSVGFGPDVDGSFWLAEQFAFPQKREFKIERAMPAIPAACISSQNIWINGKTYAAEDATREELLGMSADRTIKIVWNRFVLREGWDAPHLEHGVFATVIGSPSSYLQAGGRLLRYTPGKEIATVQDHGGCWHRHGSLNEDRNWDLSLSSNQVANLRIDRLREKKDREPYCCQACGRIIHGRVCLGCGHKTEPHARKRVVIQRDGNPKFMCGDVYKPRIRAMKNDTVKNWVACYYRAANSKTHMTFAQAEGLFVRENYYYPPRDLKLMPLFDIDWFRPVCQVAPDRLTGKQEKS